LRRRPRPALGCGAKERRRRIYMNLKGRREKTVQEIER
jgi:hypothetical protein